MEETQHNKFKKKKRKVCLVKYDVITSSKQIHKEFSLQNPQLKVDPKSYRKAIEEINTFYMNRILETGNMVILPNGLGKMLIQKNKRRYKLNKDGTKMYLKAPVNWKETLEQGKVIYHLNESTDGYTYRWQWIKRSAYIQRSTIWSLNMTMYAKKLLKAKIEDKEKDYKNLYKELSSKNQNIVVKKLMDKYEREANKSGPNIRKG